MYVAIGTLVDEKYEILSISGSGGMGVVYEAHQRGLDRIVALKLLTSLPEEAREEVARFEREALILSRLSHINIVQFHSFGNWLNRPYIAMEKLSGNSLQSLLVNSEPLPLAHTTKILRQICNGLEHAHLHGVFHRDIKPSNVIVTYGNDGNPTVKLIDFGLAKLVGAEQRLTQVGFAVGSVLYMSPEQCHGEPIDARSDVYNTGCLLYHCLTGVPPFSGSNSFAVMFQHIHEPVSDADRWNTLPEPLQQILYKCMAKDPHDRYASAKALEGDLEQLGAMEAPDLECKAADSNGHRPAGEIMDQGGPNPRRKTKSTFTSMVTITAAIAVATAVVLIVGRTGAESAKGSASSRTPHEILSYWVHRPEQKLDAQQAKELSSALEFCKNVPRTNKGILLAAYVRAVGYYHISGFQQNARGQRDGSLAAFNKVSTLAKEALDSYPLPTSSKDIESYMRLVLMNYEGSSRTGQSAPATKLIEETLKSYPGSSPEINEMRMLLKLALLGNYIHTKPLPETKRLLDEVTLYEATTRSEYLKGLKDLTLQYEKKYQKSRPILNKIVPP